MWVCFLFKYFPDLITLNLNDMFAIDEVREPEDFCKIPNFFSQTNLKSTQVFNIEYRNGPMVLF